MTIPPNPSHVAVDPRATAPSQTGRARAATLWRAGTAASATAVLAGTLYAAGTGRFDRIPLLDPVLAVTVEALAALALVGSWMSRQRRWLTVLLPAVVALSTAVTAIVAALLRLTGTVTDAYPASFALWVGMALAALISLPVVVTRAGALRRWAAGTAVPLTLSGALLLMNNEYGVWPTAGDLLGRTEAVNAQVLNTQVLNTHALNAHTLNGKALNGRTLSGGKALDSGVRDDRMPNPPPGMLPPARGILVALDPPAVSSHFAHRPGSAYLPPAYFTPARTELPVIVMLPGTPGGTMQWPTSGKATATADAYAAAHHGRAPILVFVDPNGSATADTECVDGPQGNAETYLTVDVPAFVTAALRIPHVASRWAVAGFSAGGTCAVDLALRHPNTFRHFVDLAGDICPNLGNRAQTRVALFGGSWGAMEDHDPLRLLRTRRYEGVTGWFAAGVEDVGKLRVSRRLAAAASRRGLIVHEFTGVAGHNWQFASYAFGRVLPELSGDLGLR
ncbi:hypothetical protein HC028_24110 [Planosporangium flavigriseum]|uniref:alpha/beta hydrolase n=1 Tax=Planosporangium flavigriseum TaxID=373681 RepID=UPI00143B5D86|nr:alpha/beta hydrolase-fold protein [Planosporangium flavigriseum]NJC67563.1 hypothetical protein [Planosporangium flavigriseum]